LNNSTGVGYATVQMLARNGARVCAVYESFRSICSMLQVYMAARDEGRATEAIKQLQAENINDGSVHWLKLDLSDPRAARRAANEFLEKEQRLDILGMGWRLSKFPRADPFRSQQRSSVS
jgi:NAD(P)-dependent dehydrogenase (short-subunit alcohol dehydrogenase family)